ncbi:MAG: YceI family protein [Bdellovibrionaceae bacterium]|nr:YceI family protein [Pseudobdellovibrionaceae bacterium]
MKRFLILTLVAASAVTAHATPYTMSSDKGQVLFKATALGLKFEGKGKGSQGQIQIDDKVQGDLLFSLNTLDTGIGLRNEHMKDKYLETGKYPEGKLHIDEVKNFTKNSPDGEYDFTGKLTVHGVEKPIENGKVKVHKVADGFDIEAMFDTKISQYSIPIPKYAGLALKDDVQIVANGALQEVKTK